MNILYIDNEPSNCAVVRDMLAVLAEQMIEAADTDKDGDVDGAFARGTGRTGIRTAGAFAGQATNSAEITVEGNDSAGITVS